MAFLVNDTLQILTQEGFTSEEIKSAVFSTLSPYFKSTDFLAQNVLDSQILSLFGYFIAYSNNVNFKNGVKEILHLYRSAQMQDVDLLQRIILTTKDEFSNIENLMWSVKTNTPNFVPDDCYDATMAYMRHIGDTLELGSKNEINELYAIIKIANNENPDYRTIRKTSFGVNINNILAKNHLLSVLKTAPNNLKLSDWRNIAYHHTYCVHEEEIICHYGKENTKISLSLGELHDYAAQIITACNTIDIGRRIFIFDNLQTLAKGLSKQFEETDRIPMKLNQLKTTFLTQGFMIIDSKIESGLSEIVVKDLKNDGSLNAEEVKYRKIHATQFLYPVWNKLPNTILRVQYCDSHANVELVVSVPEKVCQIISTGEKTLSYLALHVVIEKGNL